MIDWFFALAAMCAVACGGCVYVMRYKSAAKFDMRVVDGLFIAFAISSFCFLVVGIVGFADAARAHDDGIKIQRVAVHDGDTIIAGTGYGKHRIRLCGIDALEKGQEGWEIARDDLRAAFDAGQVADVVFTGNAAWGRVAGDVMLVDGTSWNLSAARRGLVFVALSPYTDDCEGDAIEKLVRKICAALDLSADLIKFCASYPTSPTAAELTAAQDAAKADGIGIWASDEVVPPWVWRHRGRE